MVNGTAKLILDFGNSSTRIQTKFGNNAKGEPRISTIEISNSFARMSEEDANRYIAGGDYTGDESRIFRTDSGDIYCNGTLCDVEYEKTAERPSALMSKYNSVILKWSTLAAFMKGYEAIASFNDVDVDSVDVEWEVTALLPPDDIDIGSKVLSDMIKSITEIDFLMPVAKKKISIKSVKVFPEGFAAFIAFLFEGVGVIRETHKYLVDPHSSTLIIDIGAGTSDIVLVRNGKVVSSSRFTRNVGGNNVHQTLRRTMKKKGIPLRDVAAREGCEAGYVYNGSEKVSVIKEVADAKIEISRNLIDALVEFFESSMIEIQSITNLLTVGGGSVESEVEGIEPISKYLYDYIRTISPNIHLVEIPVVRKKKMDMRLANVIGAGILAG